MNHSIFSDCKGSAFFFSSVAIYFQQKLSLYSPIFVSLPLNRNLWVQIDDVIVNLDVFRKNFYVTCTPAKENAVLKDAGAPVELEEVEKLEEVLPVIWDDLAPELRRLINRQGVVYTDEEGDLVTSIVNGKDCVFTCYDEKGYCYCAIEKTYREENATSTNRFPATCIRYA